MSNVMRYRVFFKLVRLPFTLHGQNAGSGIVLLLSSLKTGGAQREFSE